jgi:hypothetical protein
MRLVEGGKTDRYGDVWPSAHDLLAERLELFAVWCSVLAVLDPNCQVAHLVGGRVADLLLRVEDLQ